MWKIILLTTPSSKLQLETMKKKKEKVSTAPLDLFLETT